MLGCAASHYYIWVLSALPEAPAVWIRAVVLINTVISSIGDGWCHLGRKGLIGSWSQPLATISIASILQVSANT